MYTSTYKETITFLEEQLNYSSKEAHVNLYDFAETQITEWLNTEQHINLNHLQLSIAMSAPQHLSVLVKNYIHILRRVLYRDDFVEDPFELSEDEDNEIKILYTYINREQKITSMGLLKIDTLTLKEHLSYIKSHDALYHTLFPTRSRRSISEINPKGFLMSLYDGKHYYRFPLLESLLYHRIPCTIIYTYY